MTYDEWCKWWKTQAPTYFTDKSWQFSQPDLVKRLGIEGHHCILELGFGYGRELHQFCKLSINVYGLELTDWACENTLVELNNRKVRPLPRLKSYDGLTIPFPSGAFNVIYSCFVIQHLSRDHAKSLIKEALRTLSYHGSILFEFFGDPQYWDHGKDVFSGLDGQGGMFNNAYTADEIPAIIESCGGSVKWMHTKNITHQWGNHWVCFGK